MIVLDCSAAVDMARMSERGRALAALLIPEEEVIAPTWFRVEVRNAFWKYVHAGMLSEEEATARVHLAEALVTTFVSEDDYLDESFAEAARHDHPFYDMVYLCLTRRNAATLFTTDKKLMRTCIQAKVNCVEEVDLPA